MLRPIILLTLILGATASLDPVPEPARSPDTNAADNPVAHQPPPASDCTYNTTGTPALNMPGGIGCGIRCIRAPCPMAPWCCELPPSPTSLCLVLSALVVLFSPFQPRSLHRVAASLVSDSASNPTFCHTPTC